MLTGSILQQLRDAHQGSQSQGKRPLNFGVYYKNTLVALCHALEDSILEHDYSPLMITAFQRGKWYLQEADRYGQIAEKSPQIVIMAADDAGFAEHPTSQRDNVALVCLDESDPVAQEWHLIILSPDYTAMVLCQELAEADYLKAGLPTHDLERKFYGLWTFEPSLVLETAELAIAHLGRYNPPLQQQLTERLSAIAAQVQRADALCGSPTAENLGDIVTRVVDYLQTHHTNDPQAEFRDRFAINDNLISNELQAYLRIAQLIAQVRGKLTFDLSQDPPPDLALEVDFASKSLNRFPIYQRLGIPEIWCYDQGQLRVYLLQADGYHLSTQSQVFPTLRVQELPQLIHAHRDRGRLALRRAIRVWAREQTGR